MNLEAASDTLDNEMLEWRVKGMNGSPDDRAKFLKSCAMPRGSTCDSPFWRLRS